METIYLHHPVAVEFLPVEPLVMVLGYFDGIHLGHQAVIEKAKKVADAHNLPLAVLTFTQHPSIVFKKFNQEKMMKHLVSPEDRIEEFEHLGIDLLYMVEFTSKLANLSPEDFINQYLRDFKTKIVVTGFDYTFGKTAGVAELKALSQEIEVITVPKFTLDNEKVSSTRIREALDCGDVELANRLLGRPYQFSGLVVHGEARGRTLGFPTANLEFERYVYEPEVGVYVVDIEIYGVHYRGAASIGYNDTFGANLRKTIEVYILDFNEEIYGETVKVKWLSKIRDMVKFTSIEALVDQLKSDEAVARSYQPK
ncbi:MULTISPECIES: riboflavin biosynthesis protein RibF [unclassified Enterococcus]|uniref:riboflavin biosynthesis protein RibF n=1 Tax=unclassified Enterococcus TaxID=2608891 RepID=UPI001551EEE1|nr:MULTISPECIES: riboflavin biosynthesis protein RibF [unclassified Enterococcus]MBS7578029.1 riboflavin biosynthesis protein RibF [Enterococcus sp. MMGLQ5-2]MBS7585281.1 riboflavin biosynthesis protein RibF [Enterococcus sp. MMGLQ5-1]NPD13138.1 riboflavin biosynthesis protein RibF [Enterococcus sp. MMGLQ5-1]NPD37860.1 riboflavin biosynthesis protein RibF [Enterococcus sp. MMGLQ5-2]